MAASPMQFENVKAGSWQTVDNILFRRRPCDSLYIGRLHYAANRSIRDDKEKRRKISKRRPFDHRRNPLTRRLIDDALLFLDRGTKEQTAAIPLDLRAMFITIGDISVKTPIDRDRIR
jgi:hypothetical protein